MVGLFAGVGGIEKGFIQAGFQVLSANEIDDRAADTYRENHKHKLLVGDIKGISKSDLISETDKCTVLAGGFPCQPFSVAGYRKGFDDERGNVFWQIHRLIREMSPEVVFLENVKNLENHDEGNTFKTIKNSLEGLVGDPEGNFITEPYVVHSIILNSKDFGIPQNRERIYIVAFKSKSASKKFKFPKGAEAKRKLRPLETFIDFDKKMEEKYYYDENRPFYDQLVEDVNTKGVVYQWRRKYVRANKSGVCPTLTANMGMGGHNVPLIKAKHGIRKLTPSECFALMGFPSIKFPAEMTDSHLYKQAGNSVVVPVIKAIATNIKSALSVDS